MGELAAYHHDGFWQPMDTLRDKMHLEEPVGDGSAVEMLVSSDRWTGRKVLVTGHTGFKGGWLSLVASTSSARMSPASRCPRRPNRASSSRRAWPSCVRHVEGDVRDLAAVEAVVERYAARRSSSTWRRSRSSAAPTTRRVETFATNVMGTVHVLEAVPRVSISVRAIVCVTSDKCYENREWSGPIARPIRWAATIPTAAARVRPSSSRPPTAAPSSSRARASPPFAPAT